MGQFKEPAPVELVETGPEPEFVISDVLKADHSDGLIRAYLVSKRQNLVRMELTLVGTPATFVMVGRKFITLASDGHSVALMADLIPH